MNNFTNKSNPIETIGRGLRAALNGAAILDTPPTKDNKVNRRAGRTAIALGLVALSSYITLISTAETVECKNFDQSEFGYDNPNIAASEITKQINDAGDSLMFDDILAQLQDQESVRICGKEAITAVDSITRS